MAIAEQRPEVQGRYKEDPSKRNLLIQPDTKVFAPRKPGSFLTDDLTAFYGALMKTRVDMREMFMEEGTELKAHTFGSRITNPLASGLRAVAGWLDPQAKGQKRPIEIDPTLVSEKDVKGLIGAGLVEMHFAGYVEELMHLTSPNLELSAFVSFWAGDEIEHPLMIQQYLMALHEKDPSKVDLREWDQALKENVAGSLPDHSQHTLSQMMFKVTLQELLTSLFYEGADREAVEPNLKRMYRTIGKTERNHYSYYKKKTKEEVRNNPSALEEIDYFVLEIGMDMPGPTFIVGYDDGIAEDISRAAGEGYPDWKVVLKEMQGVFGPIETAKRLTDSTYRRRFSDRYGVDPAKNMGLG